jgi:hypothetical protein
METPDFLKSASPNEDGRKQGGAKRTLSERERRKRAAWGAVLMSIGFYVITILVIADPREENIGHKAFGSYPSLGLSSRAVGCLLFTIIYFPFPFVFYHDLVIMMKLFEDGMGFGRIRFLVYLTTVGKRHPSLRKSQRVVLAGLVYYLVICISWIIYGFVFVF